MSESIGSSGPGMKLHTKILLGLATGLAAGITTNLTVGVDNPTVEWANNFVRGVGSKLAVWLQAFVMGEIVDGLLSGRARVPLQHEIMMSETHVWDDHTVGNREALEIMRGSGPSVALDPFHRISRGGSRPVTCLEQFGRAGIRTRQDLDHCQNCEQHRCQTTGAKGQSSHDTFTKLQSIKLARTSR